MRKTPHSLALRPLIVRDIYLSVTARRRRFHCRDNAVDVAMDSGPLRIAEDLDGDAAAREVLLVPDVLVRDSRRSKPASSAAFSKAPLANLSQPRAIASTTVCPSSQRAMLRGVPWSNRMSIGRMSNSGCGVRQGRAW